MRSKGMSSRASQRFSWRRMTEVTTVPKSVALLSQGSWRMVCQLWMWSWSRKPSGVAWASM